MQVSPSSSFSGEAAKVISRTIPGPIAYRLKYVWREEETTLASHGLGNERLPVRAEHKSEIEYSQIENELYASIETCHTLNF